MAEDLIGEVEAEIATMKDRRAAGERVGQLVLALAQLAVHVAQMPTVIFSGLEEEGIEVPPGAVERFGDAQRTLSTAFTLAEIERDEW